MTDPYRLLNKRFSLQNSTKGNSSKTIAKFYETMAKSKTTYFHFNGLKLEILGSRVYTQIRPVWVGDSGTYAKKF
jgi:hypothetical protein